MKRFVFVLAFVATLFLVSCQKDSVSSGPRYSVEIAANKYASAIATSHVVFEYDDAGSLVGKQVISGTEDGVSRTFTANRDASYLTVRMDLGTKPSSGKTRSYFYKYMFILEDGKTNRVVLDGNSPVQETEPRMSGKNQ